MPEIMKQQLVSMPEEKLAVLDLLKEGDGLIMLLAKGIFLGLIFTTLTLDLTQSLCDIRVI